MVEREAVEVKLGKGTIWEGTWGNAENKRVWTEQNEVVNWKFHRPNCRRWLYPRLSQLFRKWGYWDEINYQYQTAWLINSSIYKVEYMD